MNDSLKGKADKYIFKVQREKTPHGLYIMLHLPERWSSHRVE